MRHLLRLRLRGLVALAAVIGAALPLAFGGTSTALAAGDPSIWVISGSNPGTITIGGDGWSGTGGVNIVQCADQVSDWDSYWQLCDRSHEIQLAVDPPWTTSFETRAVFQAPASESFPPRTEQGWGNGTYDCEAAGAACTLLAYELDGDAWSMSAWTFLDFTPQYGPLDKATVSGTTTGLTDGAPLRVYNAGHRPGTEAMAYVCAGYGYAFTGGCDPIPGSQRTVNGAGAYDATVSVPRWVWVNDPFDNAEWYDGANGVSILVASAGNLASPYWESGIDSLVTFRGEPLEKNPQLFKVTSVRVNGAGAITVSGTIDCTRAVAEWGQSAYMAGVGIEWTARQPVGRKSAVTAHYSSVIQQLCNDPSVRPPYPWGTHPPITSNEIYWVVPNSGGKFVGGKIHIDAQATGGAYSPSPGADQYMITGYTQWDGQAQMTKK